MSRRRNSRTERGREPSQNPWTAILYGVRYEHQPPVGLLTEADENRSFRIATLDVVQFGKLRSINHTGIMNFVRLADGTIYRVAFLSQTRAARKWIRLHDEHCPPPPLGLPGGGKRLQALRWVAARRPEEVSARELAQPEPLLPGESLRLVKS